MRYAAVQLKAFFIVCLLSHAVLANPLDNINPFKNNSDFLKFPWPTDSRNIYIGKVVVSWLEDGRNMKLEGEIGFVSSDGYKWFVPSGYDGINGASIPSIIWSSGNSPYVGKYRRASIIHDFYSDKNNRSKVPSIFSSDDIHRMFYEAMLADDVPKLKAATMYAAVLWGGPQWQAPGLKGITGQTRPSSVKTRRPIVNEDLRELEKWIVNKSPSANQIEDYVFQRLQAR